MGVTCTGICAGLWNDGSDMCELSVDTVENLMASCGSEDDATGNDDYYFKIVSASENVKSGSVKTADTTQIMSLIVMMFMAMAVIVAVKKAR